MKSAEIRSRFLEYYEGKGHHRMASASLVPSSYDASVLLNIAGMQPFKPYFLGQEQPPATRLTSSQKCFRTPDIDQVGLTARHLTYFEMLGNFSFGDYSKAGAVEMAWDVVTNVFGLPVDKLWATVHEGDERMGLGLDQEAIDLWGAQGLPRERIVPLGEDNFWKAGPTGPCGQCSEIYFDRGEAFQGDCPDTAACAPGCECDRYLEFYNLVFMQYQRDESGTLTRLPAENIDTGMGLERLTSLIQDVPTIFDIDSMRGIMAWAEGEANVEYGSDAAVTKALRVLCDHGRGMTFLASDGVQPSNEGRGYVLRRIVRRAVLQADRLGLYEGGKRGALEGLTGRVTKLFGDAYPELRAQRDTVVELLGAEEERFLRTLASGSERLAQALDALPQGAATLGADVAFQLHDTYGFPIELTEEVAGERGVVVDLGGFGDLMEQQRQRARAASGGSDFPVEQAAAFVRTGARSQFVGYGELEVDAVVTASQPVTAGSSSVEEGGATRTLLLKLDRSPFYAAGGGQVSDGGTVTGPSGRGNVVDVVRYEDDQVLLVELTDGSIAEGESVRAEVDLDARRSSQANHTATHLLHAALRDQLGDHVRQAGSLVSPDRLRFDFTHTSSIAPQELAAIEREVNAHVAAAEPVDWEVVDIDTARETGAMMLFGEKYGDQVRMVSVGGDEHHHDATSIELCGGTHVANTGEIRLFVVVGESSVGSNTRRIEALTGDGAVRYLRERAEVAGQAAGAAGVEVPRLVDKVVELSQRTRELERELSKLKSGAGLDDAVASAEVVDGISLVAWRDDSLTGDELLDLSDRIKDRISPAAVLLASAADGKVALVANVSDDAVAKGVKAGDIVKVAAGVVGGGGGGRPTMARAGGTDVTQVDAALEAGRGVVRDALGAAVPGA